MDAKKKEQGSASKNLNDEIFRDMQKKNLLNRINNKFSHVNEMAQRPA